MQLSRFAVIFLAVSSFLNVQAQEQAGPKPEPPKAAPAPTPEPSARPAESGPAVDAAKVTGSTFVSQYFNFTYDLPSGWKALDDAARMESNRIALQEDAERSSTPLARKGSSRPGEKAAASTVVRPAAVAQRYSLMAAAPNGLDSLASLVLPRVNIWAHRQIPPFDKPMDNVQLLASSKRSEILVRPMELTIAGRTFARVELITPDGTYQSRYVTVIGDFLIGFDFWAESEKEMVETANTIKSVQFN